MPRKPPTRRRQETSSASEDDFLVPSPQPNTTNYSFNYTNTGSRLVNPNQPSTSAAARHKHYAHKSTSAGPHGRNNPIREHLSRSQTTEESSPERRSTRAHSGIAPAATSRPQVASRRRKQPKPLSTTGRALAEIRRLQSSVHNLIPRAPFGRLVRETMRDASRDVFMITRTALEGIQEACEVYLVQVLTDAYALTLHRGRVTLMPKDIQLLRLIRLID